MSQSNSTKELKRIKQLLTTSDWVKRTEADHLIKTIVEEALQTFRDSLKAHAREWSETDVMRYERQHGDLPELIPLDALEEGDQDEKT